MVMDTVQLGEIEGIHHGTYREGMWWWNSRGYSSAGAEAWNCIRAIDYLQSRTDVDADRIGVTGRSGGGAYSWWSAALDERVKVACPVAGITDLRNHVVDGCVEGHCDCMFMVNTYRWDFAKVAALIAPRPLLICNTDKDQIFPLDGVVRVHKEVRNIYDLYDAPEKLGLIITEGPHKDTQELQLPVMRWFNKWLKGDQSPVTNHAQAYFQPEELKVFKDLPPEERTSKCYEAFTELANNSQPSSSDDLINELQTKTFGAWPSANNLQESIPAIHQVQSSSAEGITCIVYEFESQPQIHLRLYVLKPEKVEINSAQIFVLDNDSWNDKLTLAGSLFPEALREELEAKGISTGDASALRAKPEANAFIQRLANEKSCLVLFAPRAVGHTELTADEKYQAHIRRRMMLVGETLASSQAWDVTQAMRAIKSIPEISTLPTSMSASLEMTEVCTFAAIFGPRLESLSLAVVPRSDKQAPDFLNWSRILTEKQLLELAKAKTHIRINNE